MNKKDVFQGIYSITNKLNNKKYIDQSLDIKSRWRQHIGELKEKVTITLTLIYKMLGISMEKKNLILKLYKHVVHLS